MNENSMQSRITVRLDPELELNLNILNKATKISKAKLVRLIMKDFFDKNEKLIDKYYEETKA